MSQYPSYPGMPQGSGQPWGGSTNRPPGAGSQPWGAPGQAGQQWGTPPAQQWGPSSGQQWGQPPGQTAPQPGQQWGQQWGQPPGRPAEPDPVGPGQTPGKKRKPGPGGMVGIACGVLALLVVVFVALVVVNIPRASGTPTGAQGTPLALGDYVLSVDGVDCSLTSVSTSYKQVKSLRGQFCIVSLTISNKSNNPLSVSSSSQYLVTDSGERYTPDSEANSTVVFANAMSYTSIPAGGVWSGVLVFDSGTKTPKQLDAQLGSYANVRKASVTLT